MDMIKMKTIAGQLSRAPETSPAVQVHGLAVVVVSQLKDAEVEIQTASDPNGPWLPLGPWNEARTSKPRTFGVRVGDQTPWVRLQCIDSRSWAKPVQFDITTLTRAPTEIVFDDQRPPAPSPYRTVDPAVAAFATTPEE